MNENNLIPERHNDRTLISRQVKIQSVSPASLLEWQVFTD